MPEPVWGTGSRTYIAVRPSGAASGSLTLGTVMSRDGSGMRVPRPMSASKDCDHCRPKWMLWWRTRGSGLPVAPTCQTTAEGE